MIHINPNYLNKSRCLIILIFLILITNASIYGQSGLLNLMSIEDALEITRESVQRASGIRQKNVELEGIKFKKILESKYVKNCLTNDKIKEYKTFEGKKPTQEQIDELTPVLATCFRQKRMRQTDKIEYLGIIDEFRLEALRRYLARNTEIGVKGVWGYQTDVAQAYIITNQQLLEIKPSNTILEIALLVKKSAGIPFLPLSTSKTLVTNCRNFTTNKSDEIETDKEIDNDGIDTEVERNRFLTCLQSKDQKGDKTHPKLKIPYSVDSIKVTESSGDSYYYLITESDKLYFINEIDNNLTYEKLIKELAQKAIIPPSPEFTATKLVMNAIINIKKLNATFKDKKSFRIANKIQTFASKDVEEAIQDAKEDNKIITLRLLKIDLDLMIEEFNKLIDEQNNRNFIFRNKKNKHKCIPNFDRIFFNKLSSKDEEIEDLPIQQIIYYIEKGIRQNPIDCKENI